MSARYPFRSLLLSLALWPGFALADTTAQKPQPRGQETGMTSPLGVSPGKTRPPTAGVATLTADECSQLGGRISQSRDLCPQSGAYCVREDGATRRRVCLEVQK